MPEGDRKPGDWDGKWVVKAWVREVVMEAG
jgi:hypothetical protein